MGATMKQVIYFGMLAVLCLSGCDISPLLPEARFCRLENRIIPDNELKARLLLSIRKQYARDQRTIPEYSTRNRGLPRQMESYIEQTLTPERQDDQSVIRVLQRLVVEQPRCCQFNNVDVGTAKNPYYQVAPDKRLGHDSRNSKSESYFANFYILDGVNPPDITKMNEDEMLEIMKVPIPSGPWHIYSVSAAYSCGYADAI